MTKALHRKAIASELMRIELLSVVGAKTWTGRIVTQAVFTAIVLACVAKIEPMCFRVVFIVTYRASNPFPLPADEPSGYHAHSRCRYWFDLCVLEPSVRKDG